MRTFKMTLAYDGTRYRGWQRLGDSELTIQGRLEGVLSRMLDEPVEVSGSGRTDAGAHAMGQVASFRAETERTTQDMLAYLRHYLPEDIGILNLEEAEPRFHARLCAREKTYCYRVWNSSRPNVFERRYVIQIASPLDLAAMEIAARDIVGTHDFLAFCSNKHLKKSSVRTVSRMEIKRIGDEIRFTITGDGFLYNMVRILVGTLLEIGRHQRPPDAIPAILASRSREMAGETAPAKGLCLMEVCYG